MDDAFELSAAKMREQGMSEIAIEQFKHLYNAWNLDKSGDKPAEFIRESTVEPIKSVPTFHEIYETIDHDKAVNAFAKTAFIKLNGGLGTSMGLS